MATSKKKKSTKKTEPEKNQRGTKKKAATRTTLAGYLKEVPHYKGRVGNAEVIVLGTAHISAKSVQDVEEIHRRFRPDTVAIELCAPRYDSLRDSDRWRNLDLVRVIKEKKIWLLASSLVLSAFQKRIGETTGVKPGAEMLAAAELAEESGATIVLADREIRRTLSRAWSRLGFFRKLYLASYLMTSLFVSEEIEEEEIENLKQQDVFEDLLSQLPERYRSVKEVLIDERDRYLAEKIRQTAVQARDGKRGKQKIFAVVGAGHLPGIRRQLESGAIADLKELDTISKKFPWRDVLSWVFLGLIGLGISAALNVRKMDEILDMLGLWIAARVAGAFLGTIVARANWLTIVVTMLVAPFSFFLGFVGFRLWMVSLLVELRQKKPRVEDFENIAQDAEENFLRSLYSNRVMHLFLILFSVIIAVSIATSVFLGSLGIDLWQAYAPAINDWWQGLLGD